MKCSIKTPAMGVLTAAVAGLSGAEVKAASVFVPVGVRVDPADVSVDPSDPVGTIDQETDELYLDVDGVAGADLLVRGVATAQILEFMPADPTADPPVPQETKVDVSSTIQLTNADTSIALDVVGDSTSTPVPLNVGDVVGPSATYVNNPFLLEESNFLGLVGRGPFSVFEGNQQDVDLDGLVDGTLFIGFRLPGSLSGTFNYGYLAFADIDNDAAGAAAHEAAVTVVGYGFETDPDTAITIQGVPTPSAAAAGLAVLSVMGLCRRRRSVAA